jgi:hypothetical protein
VNRPLFIHQYPHFQKGRVLKGVMLENLRDYPRALSDLHFQNYSDGIIAGVEVYVKGENLVISKGIVKYNGRLYTLHSDYEVAYLQSKKESYLKIRFAEEQNELDFTIFTAEILLEDAVECSKNEIELARFKLKPGARLRSELIDFFDFATEFNTLNHIHCQYAGIQNSTFHPMILRQFAREILQNKPSNPFDIAFTLECLNQERIQREAIELYISNRLELAEHRFSNSQIHRYLSRILLEVKNGGRKTGTAPLRQRMIVE